MVARWVWLALVGCAAEQVAPVPVSKGEEPPPQPPNILVIVADDLGVDQIGLYGINADAPHTPTIDGLAEAGVRFSRAFATPSCSPTRAALLTGRYGRRTGIGRPILASEDRVVLHPDELTFADVVHRADYATSAVGKWHLGGILYEPGLRHPHALGFDWFAGAMGNIGASTLPHGSEQLDYFRWEKNTDGVLGVQHVYATTDTVDDAIARLDVMEEPWLLYVSFNTPHTPLHRPPEELLDEALPFFVTSDMLYTAMVEAMDLEIGRLLDHIDDDTRSRTTTFFLGDNGTTGHVIEEFHPNRAKSTLFEGGTRVPLIVEGHGVASGWVADPMVHVVDILPTVADLAGVDVRQEVLDGHSILPSLRAEDVSGRRYVYTEKFAPNGDGPFTVNQRALRSDDYKLIIDELAGTALLFALDPDGIELGPAITDPTPRDRVAFHQLADALGEVVLDLP